MRLRLRAVKLLVVGDGPYRATVERQSIELGVADAVEFAGFIDDHHEVERRLAGCSLGLAPYVPDPESFSRFADPGKVKIYLACGLPVILTNVPPIAPLLEERGAGRIVPYEAAAVTEVVIEYLTDRERLERARTAAI